MTSKRLYDKPPALPVAYCWKAQASALLFLVRNKPSILYQDTGLIMAEKPGFEPGLRLLTLLP